MLAFAFALDLMINYSARITYGVRKQMGESSLGFQAKGIQLLILRTDSEKDRHHMRYPHARTPTNVFILLA